MKRKVRRRCKCGCENITNYGKTYIHGHNGRGKEFSEESKLKMSLSHKEVRLSEETKKKMRKPKSEEHKKNISLSHIKYDPNYEYCDIWKDKEYRKDLRKDYCENADCKNNYKQLDNHHIYLDKKRCAPNDIMTLCHSCHIALHAKLQEGNLATNPKHYIIINRPDHVSYVHKETHKIIRINKRLRYDHI